MVTLADIGMLLSLTVPCVISVYKETRFVINKNLLLYGLSLIIFSLSYTAYTLPEQFSILKILQWSFLIIGVIMIWFFLNPKSNPIKMDNEPLTLIYSWKNFGAFEFAFISPLFFGEKIPTGLIPLLRQVPIMSLGINLLALFWLGSGVFWIYRNWIKE